LELQENLLPQLQMPDTIGHLFEQMVVVETPVA
jgi:hypothetical protein